jgi:transcriptional regulator GlxA family with amidase domain
MRTTPAKYVQALRTDTARRLLTSSDQPIGRVAQRSGFASMEAMRTAFQKQLGVSPSEFRMRFRSVRG